MTIPERGEDFYPSVAELCMRRLYVAALFRNLSEPRKHVRPGYPHMIKSREALIKCSQACKERVKYRIIACVSISFTSASLWTNVANSDSWERFVILCDTI